MAVKTYRVNLDPKDHEAAGIIAHKSEICRAGGMVWVDRANLSLTPEV